MLASAPRPELPPATPRHVAIIMDGNGRWAEQRSLPRSAGHEGGIEPVRLAVSYCAEAGVESLTLFAFSSENFLRPPEEISCLMALFVEALEREIGELDANRVRVRFIGDRDQLGGPLAQAIAAGEARTAANRGLELVIAVAYGGHWDIVHAARRLAEQVRDGKLDVNAIDEARFAGALATAGLPPVDLLIRTGGEQRLSNFLLWDLAYSELYFTPRLWPEFGRDELALAFDFYATRQRRFGRTSRQLGALSC